MGENYLSTLAACLEPVTTYMSKKML